MPTRLASLLYLLAGLGLAWLVPVGAHQLGLDILLVPLVVVVTASLLRIGRTLVDRLVVACAVWCGLLQVAGLAFSAWPWGFDPVRITGNALSALVLLAAVTGRRPRFRLPFRVADGMVLASTVAAAVLAGLPMVRTDATGRLALVFSGEDLSRHFAIFDLQTRVQGYLFRQPEAAVPLPPGLVTYPQGSHLVSAVLDRFLRGGPPESPSAAFDAYLLWTVLTYAGFVAAVVWATGFVAGDLLRDWWTAPVLTLVAATTMFGPLFTLFIRGYPSELAGLGLFAVVVAVAARGSPVPGHGASDVEAGLVIAVLGVALAYTYYFLVPLFVVVAVWWLLERRRVALWLGAIPVVAVVVIAGALPILVGRTQVERALLLGGPVVPISRVWVLLAAPLVMGLVAGRLWRRPAWRTVMVTVVATVGFVAAVAVYQSGEGQGYYVEKAWHVALVVGLLGLGTVGVLLAPVTHWVTSGRATPRGTDPDREAAGRETSEPMSRAGATDGHQTREADSPAPETDHQAPKADRQGAPDADLRTLPSRHAATVLVAVVACLGVLGGFRALDVDATRVPGWGHLPEPPPGESWGRAYLEGQLAMRREAADVRDAVAREQVGPDGRVIVFWGAFTRGTDYYASQFAAALQRRFTHASFILMSRIPRPRSEQGLIALLDHIGDAPATIVTREQAVADVVAEYRERHPESNVDVVMLDPLPADSTKPYPAPRSVR